MACFFFSKSNMALGTDASSQGFVPLAGVQRTTHIAMLLEIIDVDWRQCNGLFQMFAE
jgi:hypothetical protein